MKLKEVLVCDICKSTIANYKCCICKKDICYNHAFELSLNKLCFFTIELKDLTFNDSNKKYVKIDNGYIICPNCKNKISNLIEKLNKKEEEVIINKIITLFKNLLITKSI